MKCNKIQGKWCKYKHGASKIIDTFETYHWLKVAMHVTGRGAAAVLEVAEEEPDGVTKTLRGRDDLSCGRPHGGNL
jgi:hypothetical protein